MSSIMGRMLGGGPKGPDTDLTSMVTIKPKGAKPVDLTGILSKYIAEHYDESGAAYASEIANCNTVRTASLNAPLDETGVAAHLRWLTQLAFLENRFQHLFDPKEAKKYGGGLSWEVSFNGAWESTPSLQSDRVGVLFNVGALWAELGRRVMDSAGSGEPSDQDLKRAVKFFQAAAGAFADMGRIVTEQPEASAGKDTTAHWGTMLEKVMLAQAHECVLRQALSQRKPDKKKSEFFPKLAMQVAELYDQVHTALLVDNPNQKEYKGLHPWQNWVPSSRIKSMHARAYAHFLDSELCNEAGRYGEEVARLRAAKTLCETMAKLIKAERGMTAAGCESLFSLVDETAQKAEHANTAVYFEKVVAEELLPAIPLPAQVLVKAEPVPLDKDEADIFAKLIPIEIHLLASEFSDAKDQLLRSIDDTVADKSVELDKALTSMGLADDSYKETNVALPKELFIHGAALRDSSEGMVKVETTMKKCHARNAEARTKLDAARGLYAECRSILDSSVAQAIEQEIGQVQASLEHAETIEAAKLKAWENLQDPLRLLAGPADGVRSAMPQHNVLDAPHDGGASATLEGLLTQLKELRFARLNAVDSFRKSLESREILQALATAPEPTEVLTRAKRDLEDTAQPVRDNLAQQAPLIKRIVEANANTVHQRKYIQEHQERQREFIGRLTKAYRSFCDLRSKVTEGLHFYDGVDTSITALEKKIASAAKDAAEQEPSPEPLSPGNPFRMDAIQHRLPSPTSSHGSQDTRRHGMYDHTSTTTTTSSTTIHVPPYQQHNPPAQHVGSPNASLSHSNPFAGSGTMPYGSPSPYTESKPHASSPGGVPSGTTPASMHHHAPDSHAHNANTAIQNLDRALNALMLEMKLLETQHPDGRLGYSTAWDTLQLKEDAEFQPHMGSVGFAQSGNGKNRYRDIVPMDSCRVKLHTLGGGNDYVNASHVRALLPGSPDFIAAQGPTPETCGEFWKMVAQQRVRIVAMVTNCTEQGRSKCAQYWPDHIGETAHYPDSGEGYGVSVTCVHIEPSASWTKRTFRVDQSGPQPTSQIVQQYHFTAWPDRDVPDTPIEFLRFLHAVMAEHHRAAGEASASGESGYSPILVHCSAGVGRTGTFIAIYSVLNSLPHIQKGTISGIDIQTIIMGMRRCRRFMVQTMAQFIFTYRTVLHSTTEYVASVKKRSTGTSSSQGHGATAGSRNPTMPSRPPPMAAAPPTQPYTSGTGPFAGAGPCATSPYMAGTAPPPERSGPPPQHPPPSAHHVSGGGGALPPSRPPPRRGATFPPVAITDRHGNASFINGLYRYIPGTVEKEGAPVFQRTSVVPPGHGSASGMSVYIHYHRGNKAWVITQSINSSSVIAYAPGDDRLETLAKLSGTWMVTEHSGYVLDTRLRVVPHFASTSSSTQSPASSPNIATDGSGVGVGAPPLPMGGHGGVVHASPYGAPYRAVEPHRTHSGSSSGSGGGAGGGYMGGSPTPYGMGGYTVAPPSSGHGGYHHGYSGSAAGTPPPPLSSHPQGMAGRGGGGGGSGYSQGSVASGDRPPPTYNPVTGTPSLLD
eukprot:m.104689 g.104689  ORF g.104689 m.104689 type:complete len:1549 (-) comp10533_c0_seq2:22-4668(-)